MPPDSTKDATIKSTTAARAALTSGPAALATEVRRSKRKRTSKRPIPTTPTQHPNLPTPLANTEDPTHTGNIGDTTDMESMYEPRPKLNTISIPVEATRQGFQDNPPATPAPRHGISNQQPLPIPTFPNNDTPTPPSSPSPQTALNAPDRPLWSDHDTPTMEIDDPQMMQPCIQHNTTPITSTLPKDATQGLGTPLAPLRAIVTTNRDHANLAGTRNISWDPLDKYTRATMPKINDAHPTAIFDLIDLSVIDEWDSYPEGKLAAIPFGSEVRNLDLHDDIRNRIFVAAAEITKAQQISVSGPRPNAHARETRRYPSTFLIYDLSELQRRTLLERQIWSSTEITFRVAPILPCRSDFLFSIAGLTTLTTDNVRDMVFKVWQDKETLAMIHETTRVTDTEGPMIQVRALEDFLNSMEVKRLDVREKKGALSPRFNVYADSKHIEDHNVWGKIRHFLATRQYISTMIGRGTSNMAPFNCGICHSVDHPRGLCPFPDVPGWNGPARRPEGMNNRVDGSRGPSPRLNRQWN